MFIFHGVESATYCDAMKDTYGLYYDILSDALLNLTEK